MTQKGEKCDNRYGFVEIANDLEIHCVCVVDVREKGSGRVKGYEEEDSDDTMLWSALPLLAIHGDMVIW